MAVKVHYTIPDNLAKAYILDHQDEIIDFLISLKVKLSDPKEQLKFHELKSLLSILDAMKSNNEFEFIPLNSDNSYKGDSSC